MSKEFDLTSVTLALSGLSCAGCAASVEKALLQVPGVQSVTVNLVLGRASVLVASKTGDGNGRENGQNQLVQGLISAVEKAGYGASDLSAKDSVKAPSLAEHEILSYRRLKWKAWSALALAAPLVLPMLMSPLGISVMLPGFVQLILASVLQFVHGASFYTGSWRAIRSRSGNMDLLVALGTSSAWALSTYIVLTSSGEQHLYFESSGVVIALVLLGKLMEAGVRLRSLESLTALHALRPERAFVKRDGAWAEVSPEVLKVGDIVRVRAGEVVAVDGEISLGESALDESLVTGESLPVTRKVGEKVCAGALSTDGLLEIKVLATRKNSTLERIIALVEEAQSKKAPIQRFVDRISAIFVPIVLLLAFVTFLTWSFIGNSTEAMLHAVAVLVVACPCALGLATPTAILAGTGLAARMGILIRDVEALERAGKISAVALDKTGTLTRGRPVLRASHAWGVDENEALRIAAALQAGSTHPLGQALLRSAALTHLALPRVAAWQESPGRGVRGQIDQASYSLLSMSAALEKVTPVGKDLIEKEIEKRAAEPFAVSVLLCEVSDGEAEPKGVFFFSDEPRPFAARAISLLEKMNLDVLMLSGDARAPTERLALLWGIKNWRAGVRPEDKLQAIMDFESEGHRVAMVGDGINDAPALAGATLGIAMGNGTDAAIRSAGITLMRSDPRLIAAAIWVARRTTRKIYQNLFWAFAYNLVAIPAAAAGFLSPMVAGAAMALSSVSVVTSSLLLRRETFALDEQESASK